ALARAAQVGQEVGALHLDLVDDRLGVRLDRRVADREDVGHRHRPAGVDPGAHRQAAPGEPAGARHLARDALDQQLVGVAARAVLRQRLGEHGDAGIGETDRLVAERAALARQEAGGEELDLDAVLARPAGRAVDLAQAPLVDDAESDDANRSASRNVGGVEHEEGRGTRRIEPGTIPRFAIRDLARRDAQVRFAPTPPTHQPGPDSMTHRTGLVVASLSFARRLGAAAAIVLAASPLAHGADPKVLN